MKAATDESDSDDEELRAALRESLGLRHVWKVVRHGKKNETMRVETSSGGKGTGLGPCPLGSASLLKSSCHCCREPTGSVGTLIEMDADGVNGLNDQVDQWEEVEFLVDSGASATIIGEESVRAV